MEVLNPALIWIEGRCYRVNDPTTELSSLQEHNLYEDDVPFGDYVDEGDDDDIEVVMLDDSRYQTSIHVSKHYLGAIIGKKGATKMRIERDTKTNIKIPRQGQDGDIVVLGSTAANVKAATRRINIIVMSSRMKQKSTHFISIPLNNPEIMQRFEEFKVNVLRECPSKGLDESLFISPKKLHLTCGVMCLMDAEERTFASKILVKARDEFITPLLLEHSPIKIRIKGLSYMNDDPSDIHVLYGVVQDYKGLIQQLADGLVDYFYKAGFMEKERDSVKLHVTLINSNLRSRPASAAVDTHSNYKQLKEGFDGSQILKKFADYDFGEMELKDIHLSQRHSSGPDGYYQSTYVIASIA